MLCPYHSVWFALINIHTMITRPIIKANLFRPTESADLIVRTTRLFNSKTNLHSRINSLLNSSVHSSAISSTSARILLFISAMDCPGGYAVTIRPSLDSSTLPHLPANVLFFCRICPPLNSPMYKW